MCGPDIPDFYRGKSIFVTGATGFLGKALVERLLSTCPDIKHIFLLIREKNGLSPEKRLEKLKLLQLFDVLRANQPYQLEKLIAVPGDSTKKFLDLTPAARELLSEVSIIFHSAATVKLEEDLKTVVDLNVRSVSYILELCDSLPKVDVFTHVSTAYSNAELSDIEERVYPPKIELETLMSLIDDEKMTEEQCKMLTAPKPNTYAFSKAMAEHVVERHGCSKYPVAIFRPTIVVSSLQHPFPGWVESLNGPSGVIAGSITGLLRVCRCRSSARTDLLPVDMASDTLIAAAWDTAKDRPPKVRVYNCSTIDNPTLWEDFRAATVRGSRKYPSSKVIMNPFLTTAQNRYIYRLLEMLLQTIPLYLLDFITGIFGVYTGLNFVRMSQNFQTMNKSVKFFALREFNFRTDNTTRLRQKLSQNDRATFNLDPNTIDWPVLYDNYVKGTRRYVLRDQDTDLEIARKRLRNINLGFSAALFLITIGILRLIYRWYCVTD
ncbi:male sterility protein domain-containing protein [Phthorimaea operculella]|nr:male sterility protein domain-containing protein [Phthorimaea operculella]